jgi:hypothetical protein
MSRLPGPTGDRNGDHPPADRYRQVIAEVNAADEAIEQSTWALGLRLLRAQEEFGKEQWTKMFDKSAAQHLRFSLRRGQMLVRIVKDERLRHLANLASLPDELTVRDDLTRVPDTIFWIAVSDGRICREMSHEDAVELQNDHEPVKRIVALVRQKTESWMPWRLREVRAALVADLDQRADEKDQAHEALQRALRAVEAEGPSPHAWSGNPNDPQWDRELPRTGTWPWSLWHRAAR